ncbi:hypothetical protein F5Y02DRAFT_405970 [Annulohypoxylon stygium]|nr:hypothetical protein F5Y02DRAFT_405970 [Annulohypoxylon stygium]
MLCIIPVYLRIYAVTGTGFLYLILFSISLLLSGVNPSKKNLVFTNFTILPIPYFPPLNSLSFLPI